MERMMKIQEVILKAMAGKLKWWEAAEIIGVTDRTMRRWRQQYQEHGYSGLWDYRKRRPSPKRVPVAELEQVLRLYRERYFDFIVQHFHEKLREEHGLSYSYTWVKTALQEAGLVERRKKRGSHRKRRPRRPLPGMLLHIDGSEHRWFGDERYHDLKVHRPGLRARDIHQWEALTLPISWGVFMGEQIEKQTITPCPANT